MSRRRRWTTLGFALLGVLALAWKGDALVKTDQCRETARVDVGRTSPQRDPTRLSPRRDERYVDGSKGPTVDDERETTPNRALADYLESSQYPPMSRPLRETDRHLIDWNRRHERPRPTDSDARLGVLFTADRYFMIGSEPLAVRFVASGAPIGGVRVSALASDSTGPPIEISMGSAGDTRELRGTFLARDADTPTRYVLRAEYTTEEGLTDTVTFNVEHTSQAAAPAHFTGAHRSAIEQGSLAVYAEVSVREPGAYLFDANLYVADEPVAWTRFKGALDAGTTSVRLVFFGKVLTDHRAARANASGALEVRQLRGARYRENTEPELAHMKPFEGVLDTGVELAHAFSGAVYESPHKAAKLTRLRALAESGRAIDLPGR